MPSDKSYRIPALHLLVITAIALVVAGCCLFAVKNRVKHSWPW